MSEQSVQPVRPVSLFTVVLLFAAFAAFFCVVGWLYQPATVAAYNDAPDNLPKDMQWRATAEARRKALQDMQATEAAQASSYGWVDQKAGIVRLPIERAMELTVRHYAVQK